MPRAHPQKQHHTAGDRVNGNIFKEVFLKKRKVHISLCSTHFATIKSIATDFTVKSAWTTKKSVECIWASLKFQETF